MRKGVVAMGREPCERVRERNWGIWFSLTFMKCRRKCQNSFPFGHEVRNMQDNHLKLMSWFQLNDHVRSEKTVPGRQKYPGLPRRRPATPTRDLRPRLPRRRRSAAAVGSDSRCSPPAGGRQRRKSSCSCPPRRCCAKKRRFPLVPPSGSVSII